MRRVPGATKRPQANTPPLCRCLHAFYSGRVQGVGFRFTVETTAVALRPETAAGAGASFAITGAGGANDVINYICIGR